MNGSDYKLVLTLHNGPHKVSALSSLLRSLQAAIRQTAKEGAVVDTLFSNQEGPFLVSEVEQTGDKGLTLMLWFADRDDRPMVSQSEDTFSRAMAEFERCVQLGSQHAFWGMPAGPINAEDADERMRRFISNLRVFGDVTVSFRNRRVRLENQFFSVERL